MNPHTIPRCYQLHIEGQYDSYIALLDPIKDREGWTALDITYRAGEIIPSITYLPMGPCDIAPYRLMEPSAFMTEVHIAQARLQAAFEVATENKEVRV